VWEWTELHDATGAGADVSFLLLTDPQTLPGDGHGDQDGPSEGQDGDKKPEPTQGQDGDKKPEPTQGRDGDKKREPAVEESSPGEAKTEPERGQEVKKR